MTDIVFSDVAGTVIAGNPWDYIRQHPRYDKAQGQRQVLRFLPTYFGHKLNLVSDSIFREKWLGAMAQALKGMSREEIRALYSEVLHNDMAHLYHADVITRLRQHKANGATVVLVSGMFVEMVDMIASQVGADVAIGSYMAYDANDMALGTLERPPCVGERKLMYINQYLAAEHPGVALDACYGYADSYSDRSLLSAVGHSVATYPDDGMREIAQENGWEILPVS